jgi:pantothenate kinase-related protein Tda10
MADAQSVVRWRVDAERARRGGGAPGLSDEAARDYVMRFVPAYAAWVEPMRATPPVRGPRLTVVLGDNRDAIEISDA